VVRAPIVLLALVLAGSPGCRGSGSAAPEPAPTGARTGEQTGAPSPAAAGPVQLRFGWEAPCAVETHTTLSGSEESAEYRQILLLRPGTDDATFVLGGGGFELLKYRGRDPGDPAVQHGVARFLVTYSLPVEFVIDRGGKLVEVHGIDADSLLGVARKLRPVTPEAEELVRILFKRDDVQGYLLYLARREWSAWGAEFSGVTIAPGEEKVVEDTIDLAGVPLPRRISVRHAGAVDDPPGHVRLVMERVVESSRDQVQAGGLLFHFEFGRPPLGERGTHIAMRSTEQVELVTDPRTLRPRRVTYEWSRSVDEQRTWTFRLVREFRWPERCAAAP
jgi:hypothetical protein